MHIRTVVPVFAIGDIVFVSGELYTGPAKVSDTAYPQIDTLDGEFGALLDDSNRGWNLDEAFPQIRVTLPVRGHSGWRVVRYNADDLVDNKVRRSDVTAAEFSRMQDQARRND